MNIIYRGESFGLSALCPWNVRGRTADTFTLRILGAFLGLFSIACGYLRILGVQCFNGNEYRLEWSASSGHSLHQFGGCHRATPAARAISRA